jgi:hypothetical protein
MTEILGFIGFLVALYAAKKWFDDHDIRSAHNKIIRWSYDKSQVKWLSGHEDFEAWLRALPDGALHSKEHLAMEALIAANLPPVGMLNSEPLSRLGVLLYKSWQYQVEEESRRRRKAG